MVAQQIHLVRHGEVHNPDHVLYGRLPGFGLSNLGVEMAESAAQELKATSRKMSALFASPLLRAQQSARPIASAFNLDVSTDARLIEPSNFFEGTQIRRALKNPVNWLVLSRPLKPSWGEPYTKIASRMMEVIEHMWSTTDEGDAVVVSHQLPIWMVHRFVSGQPLHHDPRTRRCELSSITTLERKGDHFVEVGYSVPSSELLERSVDVGAV